MSNYELQDMKFEDRDFIYKLIEDNLKPDLTVTVLKLKPLDEFFKAYLENDLKTYIVLVNKERAGFIHITKNGEIGYYLTEKYQNKGIATNAVKEMLRLHPLGRYFATINIKNVRSNNLVKRLGFEPKGMIYEKKMTRI